MKEFYLTLSITASLHTTGEDLDDAEANAIALVEKLFKGTGVVLDDVQLEDSEEE